jgi:2-C-methyl-D-erythritol 4-phosphate cytidylyltransferase
VAAAGRGERLGHDVPKALVELAGQPLVWHAAHALRGGLADDVIVVAPADQLEAITALLPWATVVAGGPRRQDSVRLGLAALADDVEIVLVHDAARPLVPTQLVHRVRCAVEEGADAVVPVLPLADTVREVRSDGRAGRTLDRDRIRAVQTPQGFRRAVLERAHADVAIEVTDDASLVEAAGVEVQTVPGEPEAFKVTTPFDLWLAEALLARRGPVFGGISGVRT